MKTGRNYKFWFCTGSQDLYGDECLRKVAEHSRIIVEELNKSGILPFELVWKPTLITNELIRKTFNAVSYTHLFCYGVFFRLFISGKTAEKRLGCHSSESVP